MVYRGYPSNVRKWIILVLGITEDVLRVFLVGPLLHSILLLEVDVVRFSTLCGTNTVFDIGIFFTEISVPSCVSMGLK